MGGGKERVALSQGRVDSITDFFFLAFPFLV